MFSLDVVTSTVTCFVMAAVHNVFLFIRMVMCSFT